MSLLTGDGTSDIVRVMVNIYLSIGDGSAGLSSNISLQTGDRSDHIVRVIVNTDRIALFLSHQ